MKNLLFILFISSYLVGQGQDTIKVADNVLPIVKLKSLIFANDTNKFDFIFKLSNNKKERFELTKAIEKEITSAAACTNTPPVGVVGLTGGYRIYEYHMSIEQAYKLKIIAGGDASSDIGKEIYVYDHMFYKDDKDCKGHDLTWGAGVRLVVKVKKTAASLNITGLSAIAASAEIKFAEVSVDFQTIGLSGTAINTIVPSAGSYNIEKHVEYMNTINTIRSRINFTNTIVKPEIISISTSPQEVEDIKASVTAYAIKMIADKKSYQQALNRLEDTATEYAKEVLKQTYLRLIKRADDSSITDLEKLNAKQLISQAGT